jgi:hypothetical protein
MQPNLSGHALYLDVIMAGNAEYGTWFYKHLVAGPVEQGTPSGGFVCGCRCCWHTTVTRTHGVGRGINLHFAGSL